MPQVEDDMSDEELTDDDIFLKRHDSYEQDEIKRYNIGLDKRQQQKLIIKQQIHTSNVQNNKDAATSDKLEKNDI